MDYYVVFITVHSQWFLIIPILNVQLEYLIYNLSFVLAILNSSQLAILYVNSFFPFSLSILSHW